jgi:protein-tyrosine kinase
MNDYSQGAVRAAAVPSIETLGTVEIAPDQLAKGGVYGFRNGDARARPFKLLRSQLRKQMRASGAKLVGVTSASPAVGKSFVASNLAAALSRLSDVDVYLIDADLHRPALADRFGIVDQPGIQDYLGGEVSELRQVMLRVNDERIAVIPGFKRDGTPAELLAGPIAESFFAGLRALPDNAVVLFDMPPIFADDDAVLIAGRLDGFLLVVEDGKTTAKQVRDTVRLLEPTPLLGTVLNRYKNQLLSDDYGYGVGYGYGAYYQND